MSRIVATLSIAVAALVCGSRVLAGNPATPPTPAPPPPAAPALTPTAAAPPSTVIPAASPGEPKITIPGPEGDYLRNLHTRIHFRFANRFIEDVAAKQLP